MSNLIKINNMSPQKQLLDDPIELRVIMLRKRITTMRLARRFHVSQRAIIGAINHRRSMHKLRARIVRHVESK